MRVDILHSIFMFVLLTRDTQTQPVLVSLRCEIISAFHVLYKMCLHKDVNILHLSDINSFSFWIKQGKQHREERATCTVAEEGSETTAQVKVHLRLFF